MLRASIPRLLALAAGLLLILAGLWHLERERTDLSITPLAVGSTPATVYQRVGGAKAPAVIIAHGFAGSRQLMEAYALTLAQAGYVAVSFDFEGHGRNPTPMSGDVTRVDGTTQMLKREIGRVTDAVLALPGVDGRVALLGHSMASDIIVRRALDDPRIAAIARRLGAAVPFMRSRKCAICLLRNRSYLAKFICPSLSVACERL